MKTDIKAISLKPGKERAIKNLHPWIFSGAIKKFPEELSPGELVIIKSFEGESLGTGYFCSEEGLSVHICSFQKDQTIDVKFWHERFENAVLLRRMLGFPSNKTTAYRLIHGEGDQISGLVCDIFGKAASIKLSNPGLRPFIDELASFLQTNLHIETLVMEEEKKEPIFIFGSMKEASFLEHGLHFVSHLKEGQKTGYFLDQRENRLVLQSYAKNRRMLDAFSYAGGFSVYGLKGGAERVVSVDISEQARDFCKANVQQNGPFLGSHEALAKDCFQYLREIKRNEFDLIVLDPPAFAKSAAAVERAARGYKDINLLALKALESGGLLFTFSCSQHISVDLFKKIIFAAAKDSGREVSILHELSQGPDHPVSVYCPQSSYLKGLVLRVL